jgi:hypothetical protein
MKVLLSQPVVARCVQEECSAKLLGRLLSLRRHGWYPDSWLHQRDQEEMGR